MTARTHYQPFGDASVLVSYAGGDAEERWLLGQRLAASLADVPLPGVVDVAATYASVLVGFDPRRTDHDTLTADLQRREHRALPPTRPREFTLPVVFGGEHGPDLEGVARELGLAAGEVVEFSCTRAWTVRFVGSPAGAPMLDGHGRWPLPIARRADPRTHLAAGSVGLSGQQCVIYPVVSPGGWQLVGRTPVGLFDLDREPITDLRPGDLLRMRPVTVADWQRWSVPLRECADG